MPAKCPGRLLKFYWGCISKHFRRDQLFSPGYNANDIFADVDECWWMTGMLKISPGIMDSYTLGRKGHLMSRASGRKTSNISRFSHPTASDSASASDCSFNHVQIIKYGGSQDKAQGMKFSGIRVGTKRYKTYIKIITFAYRLQVNAAGCNLMFKNIISTHVGSF